MHEFILQKPALLAVSLLVLGGCTSEWYRESADEQVAAIVASKQPDVVPREKPFSIAWSPLPPEDVGVAGEVELLIDTPEPEARIEEVQLDPEHEAAIEELEKKGALSPLPITPRAATTTEPFEATDTAPAPESDDGAPEPSDGAKGPAGPQDPAAAQDPTGGAAPQDTPDPDDFPVDQVAVERPPTTSGQVVDVQEVFRVALANNRDYQTQRESVYLQALALTLARHQFAPRFFGIVTGDWTRDSEDTTSGEITNNFGFNWLFVSGARLSISALNNLFQFFSGDRDEVARTVLGATLTQPLLRGFGADIVREPLTQSERDVIYQIRTFERFRKTFGVQIFSEYYRALLQRRRVTNEYANWQDLVTNYARVQSFADAGESTQVEADQAQQQVLLARSRWIDAVESYSSAVDRLKITLGLPTTMVLGLSVADLDGLDEPTDELESIDLDRAMATALESRLDIQTTRDRVADARRQVAVAADALRMQLDVLATASVPSGDDVAAGETPSQTPLKFDFRNGTYGFGFDLDLPLDRVAERNAFVRAQIDLERSERDLALSIDNVRLTVRDAFRELRRARESYEIQKASVVLARQRVASTTLLLQAGEVSTRDLLESQSALIDALNNEISNLIDYTIARLEFYRDTGIMRIGEGGEFVLTSLAPGEA